MQAQTHRRWLPVVLVAVMLTATGCKIEAQPAGTGNGTGSTAGSVALPSGIIVTDGHGWTAGRLDGPIPAPGSCHIRTAADGEPLPDPKCTPGAVDRAVTDKNTGSTICRSGGYTTSVRPPDSLTEPAKRALMAAYGIPADQISHYELDHFIALNAGGASDVRNLWPEPNTLTEFHGSAFVHNDKDEVEEYTYHAICAGKVTASAVDAAFATNWTTAVATLGLPPIATAGNG